MVTRPIRLGRFWDDLLPARNGGADPARCRPDPAQSADRVPFRYSSLMASAGHSPMHVPHSVQSS